MDREPRQKYKVVDYSNYPNSIYILYFCESESDANKYIRQFCGKNSYKYKVELTDAYLAYTNSKGIKLKKNKKNEKQRTY